MQERTNLSKNSLIVLGGSLGSMNALRTILAGLPSDFALPMVVVLHRHADSDDGLSAQLQSDCRLPITDILDKQTIEPGHVYLAPSNYHVMVEGDAFALSTDDPVQYARPSIDVLFESAADARGPAVTGVVLTGANQDGAQGSRRIVEQGGVVVVQDPATAMCGVMPSMALRATQTPHVYPLEGIVKFLLRQATAA